MSLKQSALLLAGALTGVGLVLAWRPADEVLVQAPAAARAMPAAAPVAAAQAAAPACASEQLLAGWQVLSAGAGGYRQAGFAVLYHPQRGTVTVTEGAVLLNGLVVERVMQDGVQLRCGPIMRSLALPPGHGAAPATRTALPDPDRSASN